jgi:hypothetical protein
MPTEIKKISEPNVHGDVQYTVDGKPYETSKYKGSKFLYPHSNGDRIICPCDKNANGLVDPTSIPAFHLYYGDYEIVATCIFCGHSETVCDG